MKINDGVHVIRVASKTWKWTIAAMVTAVTILAGFTATAQIQAGNFVLTVANSPLGAGTITVTPGQSPGGGYEPGTIVTLRAVPSGTNRFLAWTGFTNATANPLVIVMSTNRSITANYVITSNQVQILWQHDILGNLGNWIVNGTDLLRSTAFGSSTTTNEWLARETADMNRDQESDIVFQDDDGRLAIWFMAGTNHISATIQGTNALQRLVGVGDFDGDLDNDLVFQRVSINSTNTTFTLWLMDGLGVDSVISLTGPAGDWRVISVFDFGNDGDPDILFRHADGRLLLWLMDGTANVGSTAISGSTRGWRLAGVDDFNGDDQLDFLFYHNATRRTGVWFMNGTNRIGVLPLRKGKPAGIGWRIVGTTGAD